MKWEQVHRVLAVTLVAAVLWGCTSGSVVDKLTIVNGTVYDLEVRASDEGRDGWVPLGRVERGSRSIRELVDDQGQHWVFRFEYAGRILGGELRIDREELAGRDWRVDVPEDVERRLRREGIEPSPDDR